jgi:hypothetical protein
MEKSKLVPMMISLPKEYRDKLRTMAAEQNLKNTDQVTSGATIAKEIICEHLSMRPSSEIKKSEEGCKNEQE